MPHQIQIERSGRYGEHRCHMPVASTSLPLHASSHASHACTGFLDEPYIEAIYATELSCPTRTLGFTASGGSNASRAQVSFFVDDTKPGCPLPQPRKGFALMNKREECGPLVVGNEMVFTDIDVEPKCLVVVIAPDTRRILFEEFMAAGRIMSDDLCAAPRSSSAYLATCDSHVLHAHVSVLAET